MPYTVTQRIKAIQQPEEGYIPISKFSVKKFSESVIEEVSKKVIGYKF